MTQILQESRACLGKISVQIMERGLSILHHNQHIFLPFLEGQLGGRSCCQGLN